MTNEVQLQKIQSIISDVVAPNATSVDAQAQFPKEAMDELARAGLLGIMSAEEVGGTGQGLRGAAKLVRELAGSCGSTAMVTCMHFCGTAVYEALGPKELRASIAQGKHLTTLAFSEAGSRSHFWAPLGQAKQDGESVILNAKKSWVTSANYADSYVWSSKSMDDSAVSLWHMPRDSAGLAPGQSFDGLGFRGNDSVPVLAKEVKLKPSNLLGEDGSGFDSMMGIVLPHFSVMIASCSLGLMDRALRAAIHHVSQTRYTHQDSALCDLPTIRAYLARAQIRADQCAALWEQTIAAIETQDPATMLRVMECKAAAADAAIEVTTTCMRVCGGAAYRKEVGIERSFRDAQAASVMGPTSDVLYDFIGKSLCSMPLF